jgi:hypothetical protein
MKNKILPLLFSLFLAGGVMAQNSRIGQHETISNWTVPKSGFSTVTEGRQIAQEIIDVVGLKANFEVQAANIPNAAAVTYGGKRYVLYNPNFINQLVKTTGNKWAAISVLAHEIGHHLNGHTLTSSGSQPAIELEADEFSGFVLRKMGASLTDAQAAMKTLATEKASRTHPGQSDRLTSIAKGWQNADDQAAGRKSVAKAPEVERPRQTASTPRQATTPQRQTSNSPQNSTASAGRTVISDRNIIGQVSFQADPGTTYLVTSQYNLVKVVNNRVQVIGKLANLNSRQYPYVIYDDQNTQLLVDNRGKILTKNGRQVGVLSARG